MKILNLIWMILIWGLIKMGNTIFCNYCGRIIPEPDNKEVNGKYFCNGDCETKYMIHCESKL